MDLLPKIKKLSFNGNNFDNNWLLWMLLNIAMVQGYSNTIEISPIGKAKKLPLGGYGHLFGHDNNYVCKHFNSVCMEVWNKSETAWFSAENYCVIEKCQKFIHQTFDMKIDAMCSAILGEKANELNDTIPELIDGGFISCTNGIMKAEFPVFDTAVYQTVLNISKGLSEQISNLMIKISDMAEKVLVEYVPDSVKEQCGDIAKIHHRLDVAAYLFESMVSDGKLTVPNMKTPICVFGVKA